MQIIGAKICKYQKNAQKKQPRFTTKLLGTNFCYVILFIYALPGILKPADAYACYYVEHQGYTDVQSYAVEPRHVTFGRKTHRYKLIFVNGVGGGNYSIAP